MNAIDDEPASFGFEEEREPEDWDWIYVWILLHWRPILLGTLTVLGLIALPFLT